MLGLLPAGGEPHLDLLAGRRAGLDRRPHVVVVRAGSAVAQPAVPLGHRRRAGAAAGDLPVRGHGAERLLGVDLEQLRIAVGDGERVRHEVGRLVADVRLRVVGVGRGAREVQGELEVLLEDGLDLGLGVREDEAAGDEVGVRAVGAADRGAEAAGQLDRVGLRAVDVRARRR